MAIFLGRISACYNPNVIAICWRLSSKFKCLRLMVGSFTGNRSGFGSAYFLLCSPVLPSFQEIQ